MKVAKVVGALLALLVVAPTLAAQNTPRPALPWRARPLVAAAIEDATSAGLSGGVAASRRWLIKLNVMIHGWLDELTRDHLMVYASPRARTALVIGTGALVGALVDVIGELRVAARLQQPGSSRKRAPSDTVPKGVQGAWHVDAVRSESMTPFLISVGAPRLVARMVGTRGKPVMIHVDGSKDVTVCVEGKADERFVAGLSTAVETPGGTVSATLALGQSSDGSLRSFTVHKAGPTAGEHSVEERVLTERGDLKCTFTHHPASGPEVRVVRVYTRRPLKGE